MASIESTRAFHAEPAAPDRCACEPVLCLHCSTGSSSQWRSLASHLGAKRTIIAPDLLGYGDNPTWPAGRRLRLEQEVQPLLPRLAVVRGPVDVVAHSFGAAVAIKLALSHPERVRSLSLYEPVLLGLLREDADSAAAIAEIQETAAGVGQRLNAGDRDGAAARFIDFWSGDGAWAVIPESRRASVRARIDKVRADFGALRDDETTAADIARLQIPVLCLSGARSPAVARRIVDILCAALPRARRERFARAGHMGPLTHAHEVNKRIEEFLATVSRQENEATLPIAYTPFRARAA